MRNYIFTNDQRISELDNRIKWVATYVQSGKDLSDIPDKSDANNATTLAFYYNLYPNSEVCKKATIDPQIAIRNFIVKFQFPNTRTQESLRLSIKEKTFFAPYRSIISVLYLMAVDNANSVGALEINEILYYFFCNEDVCCRLRPDYEKLKLLIEKNRNAFYNVDSLIADKLRWPQYTRQINELLAVLKYASHCFSLRKGVLKLDLNSIEYAADKDFFEYVIAYDKLWYPSNVNDYKLSCLEYTNYMDTSNTPYNVISLSENQMSTSDNLELKDMSIEQIEQLYFNYVLSVSNKRTATNYRWGLRKDSFVTYLKNNYNIESIYNVLDDSQVKSIYDSILPLQFDRDTKNTISAALSKYAEFLYKYLDTDTNPHDQNFEGPLQQIYYGAPGTGKSNTIKCEVEDKERIHFRTTFHPDSDYSTFVGCYKPTMKAVKKTIVIGQDEKEVKPLNDGENSVDKITYEFVPQAFTKAYCEAWNNYNPEGESEPVFLVIEEINRGNCAQIFGDIFQLLDRKDNGFSDYPIDADEDLKAFLENGVKKDGTQWLTNKEGIRNGQLCLPPNLYIWATMNTSDQSLFPIDSAFKRRWDWKYMPIDTTKEQWAIKVNGKDYSWGSFLEKVNNEIGETTSSEDKKLGFYFCKACDKTITAERFVSKVLFYIYNDVFKDYGLDSREFFKDKESGKVITFQSLFNMDGSVNEPQVEKILSNLDVEAFASTLTPKDDAEEEGNQA